MSRDGTWATGYPMLDSVERDILGLSVECKERVLPGAYFQPCVTHVLPVVLLDATMYETEMVKKDNEGNFFFLIGETPVLHQAMMFDFVDAASKYKAFYPVRDTGKGKIPCMLMRKCSSYRVRFGHKEDLLAEVVVEEVCCENMNILVRVSMARWEDRRFHPLLRRAVDSVSRLLDFKGQLKETEIEFYSDVSIFEQRQVLWMKVSLPRSQVELNKFMKYVTCFWPAGEGPRAAPGRMMVGETLVSNIAFKTDP
eukprot:3933635-Rhodomonas_salina.1